MRCARQACGSAVNNGCGRSDIDGDTGGRTDTCAYQRGSSDLASPTNGDFHSSLNYGDSIAYHLSHVVSQPALVNPPDAACVVRD